ncbi:hypothetical protein [Actinocorallia longicatena]|uniref:Uncharacterized protein n=1 Tax=Actinocorallia longicatena TaxID=111803 RepID=A0ABP6QDI7_9ACTN
MTEPEPGKPVAGSPPPPPPAPEPDPLPDPEPAPAPAAVAAPPRRRFERVRTLAPAGALGMLAAGLVGGLVGGGVVAIAGTFDDGGPEHHKRPFVRVVPDGRWQYGGGQGDGWGRAYPVPEQGPGFRRFNRYPEEMPVPAPQPQAPTANPAPPLTVSPSPSPSRT